MNIKQLFCSHIWEDISRKYLRTKGYPVGDMFLFRRDYYAVRQECVKCSKRRIVEIDYPNSSEDRLFKDL